MTEQEYTDTLIALLRESACAEAQELLDRFEPQVRRYSVLAMAESLPSLGPEVMAAMPARTAAILSGRGGARPLRLAVMPAGDFARQCLDGLDPALAEPVLWLDNFKGGPDAVLDGMPLRRPADLAELDVDVAYVCTPNLKAQEAMRSGLLERFPGLGEGRVACLGNIALDWRLARADGWKARVAASLERFNALAEASPLPAVVFVLRGFPGHYVPLARQLRRAGHPTALVTVKPEVYYGTDFAGLSRWFDLVHCCENSYLEYFALAAGLRGDVLWSADYFYDKFLCLFLRGFWKGRMMHEIYDLADNAGLDLSYIQGVTTAAYGFDLGELEAFARPRLYAAVDGLLHRDSRELMERMRQNLGITTPSLHFLPYPDMADRLSERDGEPHIVFCGHIMPRETREAKFLENTLYELGMELSGQGVHMHFYNPMDPDLCINKEFIQLAAENPRVHYHRPLPVDDLQHQMKLYDWGCLFYLFDPDDVHRIRYETTFASRFLAYVSAGIPVICSEETTHVASLVAEHGVGLIVSRDDLRRLREILDRTDYPRYRENAARLRKLWNIQAQYRPLLDFFTGGGRE